MYGYQYNGKGRGQIYSLFKISESAGNPQSRGIPTWFVLPDDMMFSEKFSGAMQRLDELRKGK